MLGFLAPGKAQAQMLDDRAADVAELFTGREEVAPEMPTQEARREIDDAIDDQHPSKEEMPASPGCKVLITRQRDPRRKSPLLPTLGRTAEPKHPRRVEGVAEHLGGAELAAIFVAGRNGQDRLREIRRLPPIQGRVRVKNLQTAHQ